MELLRYGDRGPLVELLQTALNRAGYDTGGVDGIFGARTLRAVRAFQTANGLNADGIVGPMTRRALMPYYLGYTTHTIRRGDTLYNIARMHGSTVRAIETANPGLDPFNLRIGSQIIVPLPFDVVPTNISFGSTAAGYSVRGLAARYPFLTVGEAGNSVMGKPLYYLRAGTGSNTVMYNAAHHANEWITTPVLLKFLEDLSAAYIAGGNIYGIPARNIFSDSSIYIVPQVDPDGVDLVVGELNSGYYYDNARRLSANYPSIPFPSGWKANILGVDLNLQYPAGWEEARRIKFEQGYTRPGPRDYVGSAPLEAPESRAMYELTRSLSPRLTLAYHTQGEVIYWKYLDYEPENSRAIAEIFSSSSGYAVEDTPYGSGFAGYKDWFIQDFNRPGYTIEAGLGENPLPISDFNKIYSDNIGILTKGATMTI